MEQVGSFHGPVDASKQGHGLVAALCGAQPSSSSLCHGTHAARGVPELLALTHPVSGYPTKPRPSFHGFQLGVSLSFMPPGTFCFPKATSLGAAAGGQSASSPRGHATGIISFLNTGKCSAHEAPHPSQLRIDPSPRQGPPGAGWRRAQIKQGLIKYNPAPRYCGEQERRRVWAKREPHHLIDNLNKAQDSCNAHGLKSKGAACWS